jgi:hypothetical protein
MITVDIMEERRDGQYSLARAEWCAVPAVGETLSTGQGDYQVVRRAWGILCKGDGSPIWDKPCVTLLVFRIR